MPVVTLRTDDLWKALGKEYTEEEFQKLCFDFGVELDDVTTVAAEEGKTGTPDDDTLLFKVEIGANRYDLLCLEGVARALRVFLKLQDAPVYKAVTPPAVLTMHVDPSTADVRPYVVCAVLRNITFDAHRYKSFIALQEKLHQNVCRRRTLVAIGTHDLDTLQPPFRYSAKPPADISFVPLTQSREFRADELMEFYRTEPSVAHIKPYVDILADQPVYPIIHDAKDVVLSLPPIINGEHSKIDGKTFSTRNVLIECTATDLTKANVVLNTMVCMFYDYCEAVERVQVEYDAAHPSSASYITPDLSTREARASVTEVHSVLATELPPDTIVDHCTRMQLPAVFDAATNEVVVQVPVTRSDVLHACDIVEDVAVAFGFNNIPRRMPAVQTVGRQQPVNHLTDLLRLEVAQAGYVECLTMALCSHDDNFKSMRLEDDGSTAVVLSNPKSRDFQVARTSLLPGLLKCLASNRSAKLGDGMKLFEISDVVLLDPSTDVGARNERRVAAVFCHPTGGFQVIHGLVDRIMRLNGVRPIKELEHDAGYDDGDKDVHVPLRYRLIPSDHPTFLLPIAADVMLEAADGTVTTIGRLGVVHPETLAAFDLKLPVAAMELNLEVFV